MARSKQSRFARNLLEWDSHLRVLKSYHVHVGAARRLHAGEMKDIEAGTRPTSAFRTETRSSAPSSTPRTWVSLPDATANIHDKENYEQCSRPADFLEDSRLPPANTACRSTLQRRPIGMNSACGADRGRHRARIKKHRHQYFKPRRWRPGSGSGAAFINKGEKIKVDTNEARTWSVRSAGYRW